MGTIYLERRPEQAQFLASAFPEYMKVNGTNMPASGLKYDASSSEAAHFRFVATNYGSGNLTAELFWYADTASSGAVVWEGALSVITPNTDSQDVETDAYATANTVADTHLGTTGQRLHSCSITLSNLDSLAAGDEVSLRIARLPADAGDTMTGDAILTAVRLSYSDS